MSKFSFTRPKVSLSERIENFFNHNSDALSRKDLPFKVADYDHETDTYHIINSKASFPEAYNHPTGTHVIQTLGTAAEFEQQVRGAASAQATEGSDVSKRAGIGFLLGGVTGAAIGAATSGKGDWRNKPWFTLPNPVITPKKA
jgi:hypothetical protein